MRLSKRRRENLLSMLGILNNWIEKYEKKELDDNWGTWLSAPIVIILERRFG